MMFIFFDQHDYRVLSFDERVVGDVMLRSFGVDPSTAELDCAQMRRLLMRAVGFDEMAHCKKCSGMRRYETHYFDGNRVARSVSQAYVSEAELFEAREKFCSLIRACTSNTASVVWF